ncbi:MAG: ABC transporter permease [Mycobacteriales bacterium]
MAQLDSAVVATSDTGGAAPRGTGRVSRNGGRRRGRRGALITISAASLIGAWWLASLHYQQYILPGPTPVWHSFTDAFGRGVWTAMIADTLVHMLVAVAIIFAAGLPIGIIIGRSVVAEDLSRMWLIFLQTIPTIVLISVALIFIGTNTRSVIVVTAVSGLTYFLINVVQGTRAIDRDLVEMARAYNASERVIMRTILLPSTVPYVLAGARITIGVAWQITLFSEYLLGSNGVGFQVNSAIKLLDTAGVFMWGLSIVVLTIVFEYGILGPVERVLARHQRRA